MTNNTVPIVSIKNLVKNYGQRRVLEIADLKLSFGDRLLITGGNGSGKSTLLRIMAGISVPSSGSVDWIPRENVTIGYMPQVGGVYADMTLRQNLVITQRLYQSRCSPGDDTAWFLEAANMSKYLVIDVGNLSGGFRQLAVLACVLSGAPNILLLDEPTSSLDEEHVQIVLDALQKACRGTNLIAVSTHDAKGFEWFNRHIELSRGTIQ